MPTPRIIEDDQVVCPICHAPIVDVDEGLVNQPSCPHILFVYANGEAFEFDAAGFEERLEQERDRSDEAGEYFDEWEWLLAQCGKGDVILEQNDETMACGPVSFKVWVGIRREAEGVKSRRQPVGTASDAEYSCGDHRVFFHPTPQFVRWMKAHHSGTHIYEVGCGRGNTASMLAKAGLRVTAIDLEPRTDSEFDVIKADSAEYQFEKDSVVLICRPCHNGFVVKTLTRGILCGVADVVYVGLTKNLEDDLGSLHDRFTKRRVGLVGHSGERVWELNVERLRADASMRRVAIPPLSSSYSQ
jgi:hypothetical protein